MLSVLSALTQLDFDPWQEAADLARLSVDKATRRLAGLIASLPDPLSPPRDVGRIAARLVALLPRGAPINIPIPARATLRDGASLEFLARQPHDAFRHSDRTRARAPVDREPLVDALLRSAT